MAEKLDNYGECSKSLSTEEKIRNIDKEYDSDSSSTFSSSSVYNQHELDQVLESLKEEHNLFVSFLTLLISKLISIEKLKSENKPEADHLQTEIAQLVIDVADMVVDDEVLKEESVKEFKEKIAERMNKYQPINKSGAKENSSEI